MYYCVVKAKTQISTFRNPDFQNFHKTFFLPPPSTLIGFAGAALGLSPLKAQKYFTEETFYFGVSGKSKGLAKDLWKYKKKKSKNFISDIITREFLFHNEFYIVYGTNNKQKIEEIKKAFQNPKYALTLGNSDSIAKIKVINDFTLTEKNIVENAIVEDDVVTKVLKNSNKKMGFSIYTTSDPIAYDLPINFHYESDYGRRYVVKRKTFSFIGAKMELNYYLSGLLIENIFIPIFNL